MKELKSLTDKLPFKRVNWWLSMKSGGFIIKGGHIELCTKS